jgi:hypothetical protein
MAEVLHEAGQQLVHVMFDFSKLLIFPKDQVRHVVPPYDRVDER